METVVGMVIWFIIGIVFDFFIILPGALLLKIFKPTNEIAGLIDPKNNVVIILGAFFWIALISLILTSIT